MALEWKKIWIYHKTLYAVMILLILKVFVICVEYRSIDTDMEHFKESYLSFLEVHGNRVSEGH